MRPILKYGVPAAAGLATGGYALSQGEDPGSAALAGIAGGAGAAGGLLAGRMAGKYAPVLGEMAQSAISPVGQVARSVAEQLPEGSKRRAAMVGTRNTLADLYRSAGNIPASAVQATAAGGAVPLAAGIAGLGGVALGAIPGSMGIPGFQQNVITTLNIQVPVTHPWRVLLRPHCVIWVDKLSTAKIHLDKTILSKSFT
jgi:hypothetical protein